MDQDEGAEAPPPAADAGTADDSTAEEHMSTANDDEGPSDCDSSDVENSASEEEEEEEEDEDGETNDQKNTTVDMTPSCSALLCWLRTFPVLEEHFDTGDGRIGCKFGDRDVVA